MEVRKERLVEPRMEKSSNGRLQMNRTVDEVRWDAGSLGFNTRGYMNGGIRDSPLGWHPHPRLLCLCMHI